MRDENNLSPIEIYLERRATKIVDNAIDGFNDFNKHDLIKLVAELLRELNFK